MKEIPKEFIEDLNELQERVANHIEQSIQHGDTKIETARIVIHEVLCWTKHQVKKPI